MDQCLIIVSMSSGKVFEMAGVGTFADIAAGVQRVLATDAAQSNNWVTISGDTESVTVMSGSLASVEVRNLGATPGLTSKGSTA